MLWPCLAAVLGAGVALVSSDHASATVKSPNVTMVSVKEGTRRVSVTWRTVPACYSYLEVVAREGVRVRSREEATPQADHSATVEGLSPDREYAVDLISGYNRNLDDVPRSWVRQVWARTAAEVVISRVSVEEGATQAVILWCTDVPTASVVQYGETTAFGTTQSNFEEKAVKSHSIILTGLDPGRRYFYRVLASHPESQHPAAMSPTASFETRVSRFSDKDPFVDPSPPRGPGFELPARLIPQKYYGQYIRGIASTMFPGRGAAQATAGDTPTTEVTFPGRFVDFLAARGDVATARSGLREEASALDADELARLFAASPMAACERLDRALFRLKQLQK